MKQPGQIKTFQRRAGMEGGEIGDGGGRKMTSRVRSIGGLEGPFDSVVNKTFRKAGEGHKGGYSTFP